MQILVMSSPLEICYSKARLERDHRAWSSVSVHPAARWYLDFRGWRKWTTYGNRTFHVQDPYVCTPRHSWKVPKNPWFPIFPTQQPVMKHTDLHQVRRQRRPLALGDALSRGTKLVALRHGDKAWRFYVLGITERKWWDTGIPRYGMVKQRKTCKSVNAMIPLLDASKKRNRLYGWFLHYDHLNHVCLLGPIPFRWDLLAPNAKHIDWCRQVECIGAPLVG